MPASEVSLAVEMSAAEARGGEALWRSNEAFDIPPNTSQESSSNLLKRHVVPGREINGWLMQVHWAIKPGGGADGSYKFSYADFPSVYERILHLKDRDELIMSMEDVDFSPDDSGIGNGAHWSAGYHVVQISLRHEEA